VLALPLLPLLLLLGLLLRLLLLGGLGLVQCVSCWCRQPHLLNELLQALGGFIFLR
jgi:hypothetical protein